ncbi:hypothetical protein ACTPOK_38315 [Streptomyces inhibens]|uniref:hypothetical protein n=1 Tax=Streptomyces inhibens TaxID=2293571 RepID=UPI00402AAEF1
MTRNLLIHRGKLVHFAGVTLRAWFTAAELAGVTPETLKEQDRLGYRTRTFPHFAAFFRDHTTEDLADDETLVDRFQQIKGVGPCTAAVMASHASRDPSVLGLDVWNRKILARRLLGAEDAASEDIQRHMKELLPGHAGTAALYLVEHEFIRSPVAPLLATDALGAWNRTLATSAA